MEHFGGAPFGWSPDTLRYLVAGLLVAGEIKLKVSGREVTANGQHAIDALKTNNAFKAVGVALRQDRISSEVLVQASVRLADLIGDQVVPLEPEICKAAAKRPASLPRNCAGGFNTCVEYAIRLPASAKVTWVTMPSRSMGTIGERTI